MLCVRVAFVLHVRWCVGCVLVVVCDGAWVAWYGGVWCLVSGCVVLRRCWCGSVCCVVLVMVRELCVVCVCLCWCAVLVCVHVLLRCGVLIVVVCMCLWLYVCVVVCCVCPVWCWYRLCVLM